VQRLTEDVGRQFVERQWRRARQGAGYSFAIADAASDRAAGQAGLWLQAIGQGRAEAGYWVTASARGRGAAAHALAALARWALGELRIPRLDLYAEPWNRASIRTAEKAGFRREGLLRSWQTAGGGAKRHDHVLPAPCWQ
jgi:[ribosomal protein S5]-alanine N-acetyltransferase